jgi:glutathione S-transferase
VQADIRRIQAIWSDCRTRFGAGGEFLFGRWSGADCMFAPVVMRFVTYGVQFEPAVQRYAASVCTQPDVAEWVAGAQDEPWVIDYDKAAASSTAPVAERRQ